MDFSGFGPHRSSGSGQIPRSPLLDTRSGEFSVADQENDYYDQYSRSHGGVSSFFGPDEPPASRSSGISQRAVNLSSDSFKAEREHSRSQADPEGDADVWDIGNTRLSNFVQGALHDYHPENVSVHSREGSFSQGSPEKDFNQSLHSHSNGSFHLMESESVLAGNLSQKPPVAPKPKELTKVKKKVKKKEKKVKSTSADSNIASHETNVDEYTDTYGTYSVEKPPQTELIEGAYPDENSSALLYAPDGTVFRLPMSGEFNPGIISSATSERESVMSQNEEHSFAIMPNESLNMDMSHPHEQLHAGTSLDVVDMHKKPKTKKKPSKRPKKDTERSADNDLGAVSMVTDMDSGVSVTRPDSFSVSLGSQQRELPSIPSGEEPLNVYEDVRMSPTEYQPMEYTGTSEIQSSYNYSQDVQQHMDDTTERQAADVSSPGALGYSHDIPSDPAYSLAHGVGSVSMYEFDSDRQSTGMTSLGSIKSVPISPGSKPKGKRKKSSLSKAPKEPSVSEAYMPMDGQQAFQLDHPATLVSAGDESIYEDVHIAGGRRPKVPPPPPPMQQPPSPPTEPAPSLSMEHAWSNLDSPPTLPTRETLVTDIDTLIPMNVDAPPRSPSKHQYENAEVALDFSVPVETSPPSRKSHHSTRNDSATKTDGSGLPTKKPKIAKKPIVGILKTSSSDAATLLNEQEQAPGSMEIIETNIDDVFDPPPVSVVPNISPEVKDKKSKKPRKKSSKGSSDLSISSPIGESLLGSMQVMTSVGATGLHENEMQVHATEKQEHLISPAENLIQAVSGTPSNPDILPHYHETNIDYPLDIQPDREVILSISDIKTCGSAEPSDLKKTAVKKKKKSTKSTSDLAHGESSEMAFNDDSIGPIQTVDIDMQSTSIDSPKKKVKKKKKLTKSMGDLTGELTGDYVNINIDDPQFGEPFSNLQEPCEPVKKVKKKKKLTKSVGDLHNGTDLTIVHDEIPMDVGAYPDISMDGSLDIGTPITSDSVVRKSKRKKKKLTKSVDDLEDTATDLLLTAEQPPSNTFQETVIDNVADSLVPITTNTPERKSIRKKKKVTKSLDDLLDVESEAVIGRQIDTDASHLNAGDDAYGTGIPLTYNSPLRKSSRKKKKSSKSVEDLLQADQLLAEEVETPKETVFVDTSDTSFHINSDTPVRKSTRKKKKLSKSVEGLIQNADNDAPFEREQTPQIELNSETVFAEITEVEPTLTSDSPLRKSSRKKKKATKSVGDLTKDLTGEAIYLDSELPPMNEPFNSQQHVLEITSSKKVKKTKKKSLTKSAGDITRLVSTSMAIHTEAGALTDQNTLDSMQLDTSEHGIKARETSADLCETNTNANIDQTGYNVFNSSHQQQHPKETSVDDLFEISHTTGERKIPGETSVDDIFDTSTKEFDAEMQQENSVNDRVGVGKAVRKSARKKKLTKSMSDFNGDTSVRLMDIDIGNSNDENTFQTGDHMHTNIDIVPRISGDAHNQELNLEGIVETETPNKKRSKKKTKLTKSMSDITGSLTNEIIPIDIEYNQKEFGDIAKHSTFPLIDRDAEIDESRQDRAATIEKPKKATKKKKKLTKSMSDISGDVSTLVNIDIDTVEPMAGIENGPVPQTSDDAPNQIIYQDGIVDSTRLTKKKTKKKKLSKSLSQMDTGPETSLVNIDLDQPNQAPLPQDEQSMYGINSADFIPVINDIQETDLDIVAVELEKSEMKVMKKKRETKPTSDTIGEIMYPPASMDIDQIHSYRTDVLEEPARTFPVSHDAPGEGITHLSSVSPEKVKKKKKKLTKSMSDISDTVSQTILNIDIDHPQPMDTGESVNEINAINTELKTAAPPNSHSTEIPNDGYKPERTTTKKKKKLAKSLSDITGNFREQLIAVDIDGDALGDNGPQISRDAPVDISYQEGEADILKPKKKTKKKKLAKSLVDLSGEMSYEIIPLDIAGQQISSDLPASEKKAKKKKRVTKSTDLSKTLPANVYPMNDESFNQADSFMEVQTLERPKRLKSEKRVKKKLTKSTGDLTAPELSHSLVVIDIDNDVATTPISATETNIDDVFDTQSSYTLKAAKGPNDDIITPKKETKKKKKSSNTEIGQDSLSLIQQQEPTTNVEAEFQVQSPMHDFSDTQKDVFIDDTHLMKTDVVHGAESIEESDQQHIHTVKHMDLDEVFDGTEVTSSPQQPVDVLIKTSSNQDMRNNLFDYSVDDPEQNPTKLPKSSSLKKKKKSHRISAETDKSLEEYEDDRDKSIKAKKKSIKKITAKSTGDITEEMNTSTVVGEVNVQESLMKVAKKKKTKSDGDGYPDGSVPNIHVDEKDDRQNDNFEVRSAPRPSSLRKKKPKKSASDISETVGLEPDVEQATETPDIQTREVVLDDNLVRDKKKRKSMRKKKNENENDREDPGQETMPINNQYVSNEPMPDVHDPDRVQDKYKKVKKKKTHEQVVSNESSTSVTTKDENMQLTFNQSPQVEVTDNIQVDQILDVLTHEEKTNESKTTLSMDVEENNNRIQNDLDEGVTNSTNERKSNTVISEKVNEPEGESLDELLVYNPVEGDDDGMPGMTTIDMYKDITLIDMAHESEEGAEGADDSSAALVASFTSEQSSASTESTKQTSRDDTPLSQKPLPVIKSLPTKQYNLLTDTKRGTTPPPHATGYRSMSPIVIKPVNKDPSPQPKKPFPVFKPYIPGKSLISRPESQRESTSYKPWTDALFKPGKKTAISRPDTSEILKESRKGSREISVDVAIARSREAQKSVADSPPEKDPTVSVERRSSLRKHTKSMDNLIAVDGESKPTSSVDSLVNQGDIGSYGLQAYNAYDDAEDDEKRRARIRTKSVDNLTLLQQRQRLESQERTMNNHKYHSKSTGCLLEGRLPKMGRRTLTQERVFETITTREEIVVLKKPTVEVEFESLETSSNKSDSPTKSNQSEKTKNYLGGVMIVDVYDDTNLDHVEDHIIPSSMGVKKKDPRDSKQWSDRPRFKDFESDIVTITEVASDHNDSISSITTVPVVIREIEKPKERVDRPECVSVLAKEIKIPIHTIHVDTVEVSKVHERAPSFTLEHAVVLATTEEQIGKGLAEHVASETDFTKDEGVQANFGSRPSAAHTTVKPKKLSRDIAIQVDIKDDTPSRSATPSLPSPKKVPHGMSQDEATQVFFENFEPTEDREETTLIVTRYQEECQTHVETSRLISVDQHTSSTTNYDLAVDQSLETGPRVQDDIQEFEHGFHPVSDSDSDSDTVTDTDSGDSYVANDEQWDQQTRSNYMDENQDDHRELPLGTINEDVTESDLDQTTSSTIDASNNYHSTMITITESSTTIESSADGESTIGHISTTLGSSPSSADEHEIQRPYDLGYPRGTPTDPEVEILNRPEGQAPQRADDLCESDSKMRIVGEYHPPAEKVVIQNPNKDVGSTSETWEEIVTYEYEYDKVTGVKQVVLKPKITNLSDKQVFHAVDDTQPAPSKPEKQIDRRNLPEISEDSVVVYEFGEMISMYSETSVDDIYLNNSMELGTNGTEGAIAGVERAIDIMVTQELANVMNDVAPLNTEDSSNARNQSPISPGDELPILNHETILRTGSHEEYEYLSMGTQQPGVLTDERGSNDFEINVHSMTPNLKRAVEMLRDKYHIARLSRDATPIPPELQDKESYFENFHMNIDSLRRPHSRIEGPIDEELMEEVYDEFGTMLDEIKRMDIHGDRLPARLGNENPNVAEEGMAPRSRSGSDGSSTVVAADDLETAESLSTSHDASFSTENMGDSGDDDDSDDQVIFGMDDVFIKVVTTKNGRIRKIKIMEGIEGGDTKRIAMQESYGLPPDVQYSASEPTQFVTHFPTEDDLEDAYQSRPVSSPCEISPTSPQNIMPSSESPQLNHEDDATNSSESDDSGSVIDAIARNSGAETPSSTQSPNHEYSHDDPMRNRAEILYGSSESEEDDDGEYETSGSESSDDDDDDDYYDDGLIMESPGRSLSPIAEEVEMSRSRETTPAIDITAESSEESFDGEDNNNTSDEDCEDIALLKELVRKDSKGVPLPDLSHSSSNIPLSVSPISEASRDAYVPRDASSSDQLESTASADTSQERINSANQSTDSLQGYQRLQSPRITSSGTDLSTTADSVETTESDEATGGVTTHMSGSVAHSLEDDILSQKMAVEGVLSTLAHEPSARS